MQKAGTNLKGKIFHLTKKEIETINKIKQFNFFIKINSSKIKYKKPKYSFNECIIKNKTFSISIYAPITITYKKIKIFKKKFIFLGELALINENGSFIINGNSRVMINQIIRSEGIYFETNTKEKSFTSTIIPYQGSWLTLKIDL